MKSIKPGRGPSKRGAAGSAFGIAFGVLWTVLAAGITAGAGVIGLIFPLFGVLFIGLNLMTDGVKPLIGTEAFDAFISYFNNAILLK